MTVLGVLIVLVILIALGAAVIAFLEEGLEMAFLAFLGLALGGALLGGGILGLLNMIPPVKTWQESANYNLAAIATDSEIAGRSYFLGGGYINEHRVLNYIQENGEAYTLGTARA